MKGTSIEVPLIRLVSEGSRKTSPFIDDSSEQVGEQDNLGGIIGPRL